VVPGPAVPVSADPGQLEQLLINLVRNAVDAALETGGGVSISWSANTDAVEISVVDEGAGISGTANLFVPFFTTKQQGSGIGLVLSRQIAEGHGGSLVLANREDGPGWIVAVGRVAATSADGRTSFERPQACVAEFRDGRFVRGRVFGDPAEAHVWARDIAAERAPGANRPPGR